MIQSFGMGLSSNTIRRQYTHSYTFVHTKWSSWIAVKTIEYSLYKNDVRYLGSQKACGALTYQIAISRFWQPLQFEFPLMDLTSLPLHQDYAWYWPIHHLPELQCGPNNSWFSFYCVRPHDRFLSAWLWLLAILGTFHPRSRFVVSVLVLLDF